ncbi:hypothetical protein IAD21_03451 [Abditibacteriota bacterium]|nr:hypothetical protein IAD21_03451 [Abditibacteriota bacterium]
MSELHLIVRLWLHPEANVAEFEEFERAVAQILQNHGGRIERAFRTEEPTNGNEPFEIHLVSFPDDEAFKSYRSDELTLALAPQRERLIARTEIWRGIEVNYEI